GYESSRRMSVTFFFSSRRRHTRWPRDWSSDVCSSDLYLKWYILPSLVARSGYVVAVPLLPGIASGLEPFQSDIDLNVATGVLDRSEERRVGKECRSRWATDA